MLIRDLQRATPTDTLQFCATWFHTRLAEQRSLSRRDMSTNQVADVSASPATRIDFPLAPSPTVITNLQLQSAMQPVSPASSSNISATSPTAPSPLTIAKIPVRTARAENRPGPLSTDWQNTRLNTAPLDPKATTGAPLFSANIFASGPAEPKSSSHFFNSLGPGLMPMEDENRPADVNYGRRTSVSAESLMPHPGPAAPKVNHPKTAEERERLIRTIAQNFLFRDLDDDQRHDVVNAMEEYPVSVHTPVIEQGDVGDYFYVVEKGELDVFVKSGDGVQENEGKGKLVKRYGPGASFGELALMYNSPRAATIISQSTCTLWRLDRITFRSLLLESTSKKRRLYEALFASVPILTVLKPHERAKVADALESRLFEPGQAIIEQGEPGHEFFIIESGHAEVVKDGTVVGYLGRGDYFGELALLNSAPRAATVRACTKPNQYPIPDPQATPTIPQTNGDSQNSSFQVLKDTKAEDRYPQRTRIATLQKSAFTRLLGPVHEIMKRHGDSYAQEPIHTSP